MPTPGFEKSWRRARSFSSEESELDRLFRSSDEGLAEMEVQFRIVKSGAFGEIVKILAWELELWKMGSERGRKRRK